MGAATAKVESFKWRAVVGESGDRAHAEHLIESQAAVKYVAARKAVLALQIQRSEHFPVQDCFLDVWRVFLQDIQAPIAERFAFFVPGGCGFQLIGPVLHENIHHMLTRRRQGIVDNAWDGAFQDRGFAG